MSAEVYSDFNNELAYAYKPLTYAQIQNLAANYESDYNNRITGNSTNDASYYAFNNQKDRDFNLMANSLSSSIVKEAFCN